MTIREFAEQYYLHDSSIEKIEYARAAARLTLTISFCYWMQLWYVKGDQPEDGLIRVTFDGVSRFEYDDYAADIIFGELDNEILDIALDETGTLILGIQEVIDWHEWRTVFYQLKINAANVEIEALSD